jgi:hypothetical protein
MVRSEVWLCRSRLFWRGTRIVRNREQGRVPKHSPCFDEKVPKVSWTSEIYTKNAIQRHKLPNLPFALKISPHFVISPEIVLDNGERVWYHTFVR